MPFLIRAAYILLAVIIAVASLVAGVAAFLHLPAPLHMRFHPKRWVPIWRRYVLNRALTLWKQLPGTRGRWRRAIVLMTLSLMIGLLTLPQADEMLQRLGYGSISGGAPGLSVASAAFVWNDVDPVGTTYTQTPGFTSKVLLFWTNGIDTGGAARDTSVDNNLRLGFGCATSTTSRWAVGLFSQDAMGTSVTSSIKRTDAVIAYPNLAGNALNGALDLNSITATQFVTIIDDAPPVLPGLISAPDITVQWLALGGSDITNTETGEVLWAAGTGNETFNLANGSLTPTCAIFATATINTSGTGNVVSAQGVWSIGAAVSSTQRACLALVSKDAVGTSDTFRYCLDVECFATLDQGTGAPEDRADFVSFAAGQFTINKIENTNTPPMFYLVIGGTFQVSLAGLVMPTVVGNTVVHTTNFLPVAAFCFTNAAAESTANTAQSHNQAAMGAGTSPSNRRTLGWIDLDAAGTTVVATARAEDEILAAVASSGSIVDTLDINGFNANDATYIKDEGTTAVFFVSLAFGEAPAAAGQPTMRRWGGIPGMPLTGRGNW